MTADSPFLSVDAKQFNSELLDLLCRTARDKGRVEIQNCGGGGSCVMISKEELESMERALEILSSTEWGKRIHRAVEQFAIMVESDSAAPV